MGSRANIGFSTNTGTDQCVWLYTHWHGKQLPELVVTAVTAAEERWDDAPYATRIALTTLIGPVTGPTGWGVSIGPDDNDYDGIIVDWQAQVYRIIPAATISQWYQLDHESRAAAVAAAPSLPFQGTTADDFGELWS